MDGRVCCLVHGSHPGAVVFLRETVDVDFQQDWSHSRVEVEQPILCVHVYYKCV